MFKLDQVQVSPHQHGSSDPHLDLGKAQKENLIYPAFCFLCKPLQPTSTQLLLLLHLNLISIIRCDSLFVLMGDLSTAFLYLCHHVLALPTASHGGLCRGPPRKEPYYHMKLPHIN